MTDEAEILRIRQTELEELIARQPPPSEMGGSTIVVKTKSITAYPTAAGVFYACDVLDIFGAEVEGGTYTTGPRTETLYVANLGTTIPTVGTVEIADYVPHRWTFCH